MKVERVKMWSRVREVPSRRSSSREISRGLSSLSVIPQATLYLDLLSKVALVFFFQLYRPNQ
jgi:hypothetical protein